MKKLSLIKNSFWATYGAIATRMLALVSNLLLARILLPSEFGIIGVAYIFWSFVNLFNRGTSGSFLVYKGLEDKRYVDTTYTVSLLMGLFLGLVLVGISPLAANFFGVPNLVGILSIFACNFVLSSVNSVYEGVLRRRMQYRQLANSNLIASMARVFATVGFALGGFSYWSFVIGDTAYWLTIYVLMRRQAQYNFRLRIHPEARAEVVAYSLGGTGFSLGYYINSNCDNFAIGKILGTTSLGYYNFAYQLTMALSLIFTQAIGQVGMSVYAQLPDEKQQENALAKVVGHTSYLAAPLFALFFLVVNRQTISLIFGKEWLPAYEVIPWLLIFAYFRLINSQMFSMLSAKGKPGVNAKINLSIAPLALLGFVIGAREGGITGVSIAVAIILGILGTIYCWWLGCRELNWSGKKFLILAFKPALIAIVALLISLQVAEIIQPLFLITLYLIFMRFLAASLFLQYQSFLFKMPKYLLIKLQKK